MHINEAARLTGSTQRAIKFYEEKGLLPAIQRQSNGYRDYTQEDINRLHEIQAYRKLGIGIEDIRQLLREKDDALLASILERKRSALQDRAAELASLEAFIAGHNAQLLDEQLDFDTIAQAIRAQLPGWTGKYLVSHFASYLNIRITTCEQQQAYDRILAFWDNPALKLPVLFRICGLLSAHLPHIQDTAEAMDSRIHSMLHPSEEDYARIKAQTLKIVRMRENPLIRYNPFELAKRRMMRSLRNCGYYDLFISEMKRLSPAYRAYHDAMDALNERLCRDLSLYYDSDYNLRIKR